MQEMTVVTEKFENGIRSMDIQVKQAIAAIRDEASCDIAANLVRECADQVDLIEAELGPNRDDAKGTYERLRDKIVALKKPYLDWKLLLNRGVAEWRAAIKREIEESNRRSLEAAAKEAKAKAEREAAKHEKKGNPEMAAEVRSNAVFFAPPLQEMPKNKGVVDKVTWCVDVSAIESERWKLIKFLVEGGPNNQDLFTLNPGALKRLAALRYKEMASWPGIRVYPVTTSEVRRDSRTA